MKKNIYLILSIIFALITLTGLIIALPLIMFGYASHRPDELNGLAGFLGFVVMAPTLIAASVSILLFSVHRKRTTNK